ncbi:uncharacterized protein LOC125189979 [Salvia hispanica]|uniref:uncharacterized protein LOC125189979 n=1 Tax=Salvia hispanica TaxID=49212 RepID=UPI002009B6AA|nr:uncharacterized protein LOC125189979 [Salvia hispanica]
MEDPPPRIIAPCGDSNSPEFEFWMVRNPSLPPLNLLSADELFSGGVLLPLHHLNLSNQASESAQLSTNSKRWRDIFRKKDKRIGEEHSIYKKKDKSSFKEKRRDKKNGSVSAELNINIWPFAGSKSRPVNRKVSSAPCSRSNSKARKWASSPGRGGVHLGRSRQVRRRVPVAGTSKARVLSFKVPVAVCMGYRQHFSCRSDENSARGGEGVRGANLFNIRSLFTKKLY